jgi:hypothetical protein
LPPTEYIFEIAGVVGQAVERFSIGIKPSSKERVVAPHFTPQNTQTLPYALEAQPSLTQVLYYR